MNIFNSDGQFSDEFRDAYEKFYNDNYPLYYNYANKILEDHAAADDVVSTVFKHLIEKFHDRSLELDKLDVRYVMVCIRNGCYDHFKNKSKEQNSQTEMAKMTQLEKDFSAEKEIVDELYHMLRKLDPTLRLTMELLYLHEVNAKTIAKIMDVSPPTVYARKDRALKILKELYRKTLSIWYFITLLFPCIYRD
jgi:RNA polymerase sigma factor (sigma-70 family)